MNSVPQANLQMACRFDIVSCPLTGLSLSNLSRAITLEKNDEPPTRTKAQSEESDKGHETIAGFRMFQTFATDAVERIDSLYSNEPQAAVGMETGFHQLDELTGGFRPGELVVVAGRPKSGRTAFAAQAADHVSRSRNSPCAYYTVGLTGEELASPLCQYNLRHLPD
jgi:replicative DNA helicase